MASDNSERVLPGLVEDVTIFAADENAAVPSCEDRERVQADFSIIRNPFGNGMAPEQVVRQGMDPAKSSFIAFVIRQQGRKR